MNLFLSYVFFLIIVILWLRKKYNLLFILLFSSITANLFSFSFFGSIRFYALINLLFLIFSYSLIKQNQIKFKFIFKYELILLILTGITFTIFYPWETQFVNVPLSQKLIPKAITGLVRYFLDLSLLFTVPVLISRSKFRIIKKFINFILYFLIIQLFISAIDYYTGNSIRNLLFIAPDIIDRFNGFNHEPRAFGRNSLYMLLLIEFLFTQTKTTKQLKIFTRFFAYLSILLSFSLSAIIALAIISFFSLSFKSIKNNLKYISFGLIFFGVISQTKYFKSFTSEKFTNQFIENDNFIFFKDDVFSYNNAYYNFILDNPLYLISGTGPNLINIAYEDYAIQNFKLNDKDYFVSTAPTFGLFRLLARSGLIGFIVYLLFFIYLRKHISRNDKLSFKFLLVNFILVMIVYTPFFFFNLSMLIYFLSKNNKTNVITR